MFSTLLFSLCISSQLISLFVKLHKTKMWFLIFAALMAFINCFASPVGFLWIIVTIICGVNAYGNYRLSEINNKEEKLPSEYLDI